MWHFKMDYNFKHKKAQKIKIASGFMILLHLIQTLIFAAFRYIRNIRILIFNSSVNILL